MSTEYQSIVLVSGVRTFDSLLNRSSNIVSSYITSMTYTDWVSGCLSLAPILSAVDENELLDLDLDDLEDLADALGESFLDFFLLDFLGGFGMSGYGVDSWLVFSGKIPKGDISRGSSKSAKRRRKKSSRSVTNIAAECKEAFKYVLFFFASEKIKLPFPNVLLTCYTFYHWYFLVNPCLIRWKVVRMWRVNSGIQLCLVWFNLVMMCRVNSEYLYWTVCIEIWCDGCFQEVFSWAQKWQGWDGWVFIECG